MRKPGTPRVDKEDAFVITSSSLFAHDIHTMFSFYDNPVPLFVAPLCFRTASAAYMSLYLYHPHPL